MDLGEPGKDNDYGAGRIDAYEALRKIPIPRFSAWLEVGEPADLPTVIETPLVRCVRDQLTVRVQVTDRFGNPSINESVSLTWQQGLSMRTKTQTTDDHGRATFEIPLRDSPALIDSGSRQAICGNWLIPPKLSAFKPFRLWANCLPDRCGGWDCPLPAGCAPRPTDAFSQRFAGRPCQCFDRAGRPLRPN